MSVPFEPPPLNNRYRGGRGQGLQRGPFLARYLARCVMITVLAVVAGLLQFPLGMVSAANAADPCAPVVNAIACENSKPGTPVADWDIDGAGDPAIQGFATQMSTNAGNSVDFRSIPVQRTTPSLSSAPVGIRAWGPARWRTSPLQC